MRWVFPAGKPRAASRLLGPLLFCAAFAHAQPPVSPVAAAASEPSVVDTVTIEARRRKELEREVEHFVHSVTGNPFGEALARWDTAVCPLVAGLPQAQGEFMLARLSQVATEVHAPLAGEKCAVNFYIVLTSEPDVLLRKWAERDKRLFNTRNGRGAINSFLKSSRPVRVWYNSDLLADGAILDSSAVSPALSGGGMNLANANVPVNTVHSPTRLRYGAVPGLSSVIVVVDTTRMAGLSFGQLADYIAMTGLAQLRQDADTAATPTILALFKSPDRRVAALSSWDQAFLSALYGSDQGSVTQVSSMERRMLDSIAP